MADFQQALRWLAQGRAVGRDNEPRLYVTDCPSWLDMISTKWRLLDEGEGACEPARFWLIRRKHLTRVAPPLDEWKVAYWTGATFAPSPEVAARFARDIDAMAVMAGLLHRAPGLEAVPAHLTENGVKVGHA